MVDAVSAERAREIACKHLSRLEEEIGEPLQLVDGETIEESFGWVFFYNAREYLETGDFRYTLAGNAPFIVDRRNGDVHMTGTAEPIESYIADFSRRYQNN